VVNHYQARDYISIYDTLSSGRPTKTSLSIKNEVQDLVEENSKVLLSEIRKQIPMLGLSIGGSTVIKVT